MSAIFSRPLCQVPGCTLQGSYCTASDLILCDRHETYILFIRSLVEAQHDNIEESEITSILKKEIEKIPVEKGSFPELILLEGGAYGKREA